MHMSVPYMSAFQIVKDGLQQDVATEMQKRLLTPGPAAQKECNIIAFTLLDT